MTKFVDNKYNFPLVQRELKIEYENFKSKLEKYSNFVDWACKFSQPVNTKQLTLDLAYI